MECVSCEALLDELRRGVLPARVEAEARSHLAQCPSCRGAHMRLLRDEAERALPPPPTTPAARLRSGLAFVRMLRPRPKPKPEQAPRSMSVPGAGLGVIGRLATGPQVAMGSVMLLIVLVGLWSVPQLTRQRATRYRASLASERVHKPRVEPEPAAAPVGAVEPTNAEAATPDRNPDPRARSNRRGATTGPNKGDSNDLEAAMQYYRAKEYALATPLFSRALVGATSSADETTALLYLARAERALGHCDRAVNSYDTLVHIHHGKPEAKVALREAVACYTRNGDYGKAQRLLEYALQTPQLEREARSVMTAYPAFARKAAASGPVAPGRSR